MFKSLRYILFLLLVLATAISYSQAPNISYSTPQTFTTGTPIATLIPSNTGGAVPATIYGQVTTFAGTSGVNGAVNGTGKAASFNFPTAVAVDAAGNLYVADDFNNLVRKITPTGVVSTFAGSGLTPPFSNLNGIIVDPSGNIFVSDQGNELIRKITPGGVVSTFAGQIGVAGATNGQGTNASFFGPTGLAADKNGNIYVTESGNYLIRRITAAGLVSTYAGIAGVKGATNGPATTATFIPGACAIDGNGNLYVADSGNNLIRLITPSGVVSTFAGSGAQGSSDGPGTSASFYQPNAITVDNIGNVYVGDDGNNVIRKITPGGLVSTLAGAVGIIGATDGTGTSASFNGIGGLAIDLSGNLYEADVDSSLIRKISTTGYTIDKALPPGLTFDPKTGIMSGTPTAFSAATNYTITAYNTSGSSKAIVNIAVTGNLNFGPIPSMVYGAADFSPAVSNAGSITYTSSNTSVADIVAGKIHILSVGKSTITATNGATTIQQLLTVTPAQLSVIADNKSKAANAVNPVLTISYGGFVNGDNMANLTTQPSISTPATATSPPGSYPINISGAAASNYTINYVAGTLTILGGSTVLAAPILQYASRKVYTSGIAITPLSPVNTGGAIPATVYGQVSTFAGTPGVTGAENGNGNVATFGQLDGITIDASGNLYVTDETSNLVRKITTAGLVSTLAGSGSAGSANGTGTAASFNFPGGLTADNAGNLYVTEEVSNLIRQITPQGVVSTFAGGGSMFVGQRLQVGFVEPNAITIDKNGNFYIVDEFDYVIRKIAPDGSVSTFAGTLGVSGSANGQGTSASFNQSRGITSDAMGNIYVADGGNYLIRKITPDGLVSTLAGNGKPGSFDGIGTAAGFSFMTGITADAIGNIYVADSGGNNIRKITPGGVVTTIAGAVNIPNSLKNTYAYVDGIGTTARFFSPNDLTLDASGDLYIADSGNRLIRKMITTGYSIDKPLPAGLIFDATTGIISGTPTVASAATNYTISAYNIGGGSTAIVSIEVAPINAALSSIKLTPASTLTNTGTTGTTTTYTTSVPTTTTSVTVTPTTQDPNATVKVNGTTVVSGTASASIPLVVGANTLTTVVTAQDGTTTHTYAITVTRAAGSNNALLSAIKLTPASTLTNTGTTGTTTTYTTSVSYPTASVTVTPTAQDPAATIKVKGVTVASGTASGSIALAVGANTISTVVTAQDGTTTRTYSITVTRAGPSNNALLSAIKLTPASALTNTGTSGTTTTYTTTAAAGTTSVTVTPTAQDLTTTIKVNGIAVTSGTASSAIPVAIGKTTITIVTTAQDGTTTRTYSIIVTRTASSNALLSTIKLTPASALTNTGTSGTTTTYTTSVSNATTSVTVTATAQDANAKIKVNGVAVASGTASGSIALAVGQTTITTTVTAQDGTTTRTYSITVTRATGPLHSLYLPVSVIQPADILNIENDGIMVHQGVSPNGDGINDFLTIDGIIAYPNNSLQIIDRSGTLIYQAKHYNNIANVFDGHSGVNGRMQQPGTYFYSLDYVVDGQNRHKTGFILLKY